MTTGSDGSMFLQALEQLDAIHAGHLDVGDHDVELLGAGAFQGVLTVVDRRDAVAFLTEHDAQELGHALLVVDHQDFSQLPYRITSSALPASSARAATPAVAGNVMRAMVPRSSCRKQRQLPAMALHDRCAIGRPKPVPPFLVVKNNCPIRARCSGRIPVPVSRELHDHLIRTLGAPRHRELAGAFHGVERVARQVEPHLTELLAVGLDLGRALARPIGRSARAARRGSRRNVSHSSDSTRPGRPACAPARRSRE